MSPPPAGTGRTGSTRPGEGRGLGPRNSRQGRTPAERNRAILTLMAGLVLVVVVMLAVRQLGGASGAAQVEVIASGLGPVRAVAVCPDGRIYVDAEVITGPLNVAADGTSRPDDGAPPTESTCPATAVVLEPFVASVSDGGGEFTAADGVISRRDPDGTVVVVAGDPVPLIGIAGIAVDPAEHVFVSLPDGLRELTPSGTMRQIDTETAVATGPIVAPALGVIIVGTAAGDLVRVQLPR